jgi:hypothetical protein
VWIAAISSSGPVQQDARGAGGAGAEDVLVDLEGSDDHDARLGGGGEHLAGRRDPVHLRHADVHQHDVGGKPPRRLDRGEAVGRLAHHLDRLVAREDRLNPSAHQLVVVDDEDPDRRAHPRSPPLDASRRSKLGS